MGLTITNIPKHADPQAVASAIEALTARFGNRLVTSLAVREQHGHTTTWLPTQPPGATLCLQRGLWRETLTYPAFARRGLTGR